MTAWHGSRRVGRHGVSDAQDIGIVGLADRLWQAAVDRAPIEPLTGLRPGLTVQDAYAIQAHNVGGGSRRARWSAGAAWAARRGARSSSSSASTSPTSGCCSTTCSSTRATSVAARAVLQPRVVATMAFVLAADLAGPGRDHARRARPPSAGVMPAIEVVDSRIAYWQVQLADTVADNASRGQGRPGRPDHPGRGRGPAAARGAAPRATVSRSRARPARPRSATRPLRRVAGEQARRRRPGAAPRRHRAGRGRCTAWCRSGRPTASTPSSRTSASVSVRFADGGAT